MTRTFVGPANAPDKYELTEQKSAGGEGEVWRGAIILDSVHVPVAVKRILDRNDANRDEWRTRWQRQAEMLRSLQHPRVVQVRELFEGPQPHEWHKSDPNSSSLYLVMNWSEGPTLTEWVARNPDRDAFESIRVIGGLAEAVDYLHGGTSTGQPVIHRDIKPSNLIVTKNGPVLVDFGFVRGIAAAEPMTVVGSPAYMPPEAVTGQFSTASDLYSLGATAYFALTGTAPIPGDTEAMRLQLGTVKGLEGRRDLQDHVLAMLRDDPKARPSSAIEWAQTLGAMSVVATATATATAPAPPIDAPPPVVKKKSRMVPALIALVLLGAIAAGAFVMLSGGEDEPDTVASGDNEVQVTDDASDGTADSAIEEPDEATSDDASADDSADEAEAVEDDPEEDDTPTTEAPATSTSTAIIDRATLPYTMTNLTGMSLDDLTELAIEEGFVLDVSETPQAGEAGLVLSHTPGLGIPVDPGETVTVSVSGVAVMPNVATLGLDEARSQLQALGATVLVVDEYEPALEPGTYMSQEPAAGAAVPDSVTLTVVSTPPALFIEELSFVTSTYYEEGKTAQLSGETYVHAMRFKTNAGACCSGSKSVAKVEYNLSRDFDVFAGVLGYYDRSSASGQVRVEIFADGVELYEATLTLGDVEQLRIPVTDVLRLKVVVTALGGLNSDIYTYIGEARLIAPPEVIEAYNPEFS